MEEYQVIEHCLIIPMPAEVDHHLAGEISRRADEFLMDSQVHHIVFDFENTTFMDSSGIGIIMGRYKKISLFGGKLYATHVDKTILRILQMAGLHKIMEIV